MDEKQILRKKYKCQRDSLSKKTVEYSRLICESCAELDEFKSADTILLYFAKGSEVDLSSLAEIAYSMGKRVAYPRCSGEGRMSFHKIASLPELEKGAFGIMEPPSDAPLCRDSDAVCFVPALAFDTEGFRLGWGGGYYDRFLADFKGCKIGVAYDICLADKLPRGEFDIKTDYIVTESRVKRTIED